MPFATRSESLPPCDAPSAVRFRNTQKGMCKRFLDTQITGRAFIPANRQTIVVSNHCSHLDMGLVKYALGPYGAEAHSSGCKRLFLSEATPCGRLL